MEDMASFWSYQEGVDELNQKLLYTMLELEKVKSEANEEMKKNKDCVKQLIGLLKTARQERDEARNQLQKLLNKIMSSAATESQHVKPTKANSSITESNSPDTYNYQSHGSSPVESLFDAVSSPELSSINLCGDSGKMAFMNQPLVQDYNANCLSQGGEIDHASLVIDDLVKGRTLPQKGKFLQSVLEAGPLLQTLLLAGPLPRWRNPPRLQPFQIPLVSLKGSSKEAFSHNLGASFSPLAPKPLHSQPYTEISCGSSQNLANSMLNFGNGPRGSCLWNGNNLVSTRANANSCIPLAKRHRSH